MRLLGCCGWLLGGFLPFCMKRVLHSRIFVIFWFVNLAQVPRLMCVCGIFFTWFLVQQVKIRSLSKIPAHSAQRNTWFEESFKRCRATQLIVHYELGSANTTNYCIGLEVFSGAEVVTNPNTNPQSLLGFRSLEVTLLFTNRNVSEKRKKIHLDVFEGHPPRWMDAEILLIVFWLHFWC